MQRRGLGHTVRIRLALMLHASSRHALKRHLRPALKELAFVNQGTGALKDGRPRTPVPRYVLAKLSMLPHFRVR